MAKTANAWGSVRGQMEKIAAEGRQPGKPKGSQPDEATELKPDSLQDAPAVPVEVSEVPAQDLPTDEAIEPGADEAVALQPHKAAASRRAKPAPNVPPEAKAEKRSTSLYLSGGAMRALRMIAASEGVRPHRVIDDALRAHFKRKGYDFDALNATV